VSDRRPYGVKKNVDDLVTFVKAEASTCNKNEAASVVVCVAVGKNKVQLKPGQVQKKTGWRYIIQCKSMPVFSGSRKYRLFHKHIARISSVASRFEATFP